MAAGGWGGAVQEAKDEENRVGISAWLFSTSVLSFKKDLTGEDSFQEWQHREAFL